jgi:hypothetical protein
MRMAKTVSVFSIKMMAIFTVDKAEVSANVKDKLSVLCVSVVEKEDYFAFIPKTGYFVSVGVLLTELGISYQLDFDNHTSR